MITPAIVCISIFGLSGVFAMLVYQVRGDMKRWGQISRQTFLQAAFVVAVLSGCFTVGAGAVFANYGFAASIPFIVAAVVLISLATKLSGLGSWAGELERELEQSRRGENVSIDVLRRVHSDRN